MSSYSSCSSSENRSRRRPKVEMHYEGNPRFCSCQIEGRKLKAPRVESWTNDNPGRRFYGCRNYKTKNCGFFEWHDEPMSARAKDVINDLMIENESLWDECQKMKKMKMKDNGEVESEISELWVELQQLKALSVAESKKGRKITRMAFLIVIVCWILLMVFFFVF